MREKTQTVRAATKPLPAPAQRTKPSRSKRSAAQPAPGAPTPPAVGATPNAAPTPVPAKSRAKLVRDSFTMPEADFAVIATLKSRALGARRAAKKSELLRAGLRALAGLDATALVAALDRLEPVKTGRPKKGH